jgi:catechol 2,3-dioxygenase-like lactoylglutathione lyase family enzyme
MMAVCQGEAMDQQTHFVTLATPDLDAARRFYVDGLGWTPLMDVPDEILFFQVAPGLTLGLYDATHFARDLGRQGTSPGPSGLTLSHNVADAAAVDAAVRACVAAGAAVITEPQRADFGGYHAHVSDPNGVIWEICHNPGWSVSDDGLVHLGPVED